MRWVALAVAGIVLAACGGPGGGSHPAAHASPKTSPSASATPCDTAQCRRNNFHPQDLTFSGALNGHVSRSLVGACDSGAGGGFDLNIGDFMLGPTLAGLNLEVGKDFHGAGRYDYGAGSGSGADGAVSAGYVNGVPVRYYMVDGSLSFDDGARSGSVDGDFALQTDAGKRVHLTGKWSCAG